MTTAEGARYRQRDTLIFTKIETNAPDALFNFRFPACEWRYEARGWVAGGCSGTRPWPERGLFWGAILTILLQLRTFSRLSGRVKKSANRVTRLVPSGAGRERTGGRTAEIGGSNPASPNPDKNSELSPSRDTVRIHEDLGRDWTP